MLDWLRLGLELARWRRAGRRPRLWWRDDDAGPATARLHRLVSQAARAGAPLALSVIPAAVDANLGAMVNARPNLSVLQHGVDHRDGGDDGLPSQFASQGASGDIAARLAWGWDRLAMFDRRLPVYVPPWNRLTPNVSAALASTELQWVSAWAAPAGERRVDAHVDLMRWKPRPRFAGRARVLRRLRQALSEQRRAGRWDDPIGLLTHHQAHDEAAWRFLAALLDFGPLIRTADWLDAGALFVSPP